jgi:hypothetical protein
VGRLGGSRGPPQRGSCLVCALKQDVFSFGFLHVLSGISPVVLGDPQGCPRHLASATLGEPGAAAALGEPRAAALGVDSCGLEIRGWG